MANIYGRQVVVPLTNKSGGSVIAGDVVVVDTGNNEAFTTSTAGAVTGGVGVAQETIANNATGRVLLSGYAALVNTSASVTRGNFGKTHTVAKQAVDAGASRSVGTFCQFLTGGTTPTARVFPPDLNASSGSVATDAIWDAKGDLAVGTGADTAARLAVGANGEILKAASGQTTGLIYAIAPKFRGCKAISNSTTTMTTAGTEYAIALAGTDEYDTDAMHDPASNNTRVTVPAALDGLYFMARGTVYVPVTAGNNYLELMIRKNANAVSGAGTRIAYVQHGVGAGNPVLEVLSAPFTLATSDYIELFASSNVASRTADAGFSSLALWVVGAPS